MLIWLDFKQKGVDWKEAETSELYGIGDGYKPIERGERHVFKSGEREILDLAKKNLQNTEWQDGS